MAVRYHPSDCQILTTGTNRKIAYWETYDGSLIRDFEGSTASGLNTLDITGDGNYIVTGGNDQMVKVRFIHILFFNVVYAIKKKKFSC